MKHVVGDLTITHCYDTKLPVGTFKCGCGFIYSRINDIKNRQVYREKWLSLRNEMHDATVNDLRKIDGATYIWLYRHDREWLKNNLPKNKSNKCKEGKIDWNRRDGEIYSLVISEIEYIMSSNAKPVRITIGRVGKNIGKLALIEKHLDKMPLTKEYLISKAEGDYEFSICKIYWACNELDKENKELKLWEVLRRDGIRHENWELYKDTVCKIIANQYNDKFYESGVVS